MKKQVMIFKLIRGSVAIISRETSACFIGKISFDDLQAVGWIQDFHLHKIKEDRWFDKEEVSLIVLGVDFENTDSLMKKEGDIVEIFILTTLYLRKGLFEAKKIFEERFEIPEIKNPFAWEISEDFKDQLPVLKRFFETRHKDEGD